MERHQREWKNCLHSDSNRDHPAYAADCSAVELLRPRPDSYIYICIYIRKINIIGMQPDLNLRRQRLAARSSQMVTAKPLGQLKKLASWQARH